MRQPTQKQLDYAKRIADKYIARDGGRPAVEPRLQALALAEAWEDGRMDWPMPSVTVNCRCALPNTMEEITAILEKAS